MPVIGNEECKGPGRSLEGCVTREERVCARRFYALESWRPDGTVNRITTGEREALMEMLTLVAVMFEDPAQLRVVYVEQVVSERITVLREGENSLGRSLEGCVTTREGQG